MNLNELLLSLRGETILSIETTKISTIEFLIGVPCEVARDGIKVTLASGRIIEFIEKVWDYGSASGITVTEITPVI